MPIPERFKLPPIPEELFQRMSYLCGVIDSGSNHDVGEHLAEWNKHSNRKCEAYDLEGYRSGMDKVPFVRSFLHPIPVFVEDVFYSEVVDVLNSIWNVEGTEDETSYYLNWLEAQFPNSNISDLIYWPDEWFGDESLFRDENGHFKTDAELSVDQIIAYAMAKSKRMLTDAPTGVRMPYPLPES
ncbi:MAG: hypothetical protein KDA65_15510 [Planctomycetaceae bacterium]|nr:hypothetical protein [Planctomycetaceae bacterium]